MGLEKEAKIEIFANGIADISLLDFRVPNEGSEADS